MQPQPRYPAVPNLKEDGVYSAVGSGAGSAASNPPGGRNSVVPPFSSHSNPNHNTYKDHPVQPMMTKLATAVSSTMNGTSATAVSSSAPPAATSTRASDQATTHIVLSPTQKRIAFNQTKKRSSPYVPPPTPSSPTKPPLLVPSSPGVGGGSFVGGAVLNVATLPYAPKLAGPSTSTPSYPSMSFAAPPTGGGQHGGYARPPAPPVSPYKQQAVKSSSWSSHTNMNASYSSKKSDYHRSKLNVSAIIWMVIGTAVLLVAGVTMYWKSSPTEVRLRSSSSGGTRGIPSSSSSAGGESSKDSSTYSQANEAQEQTNAAGSSDLKMPQDPQIGPNTEPLREKPMAKKPLKYDRGDMRKSKLEAMMAAAPPARVQAVKTAATAADGSAKSQSSSTSSRTSKKPEQVKSPKNDVKVKVKVKAAATAVPAPVVVATTTGIEEKYKMLQERQREKKNRAKAAAAATSQSDSTKLQATGRASFPDETSEAQNSMLGPAKTPAVPAAHEKSSGTVGTTQLDFAHHVLNQSPIGTTSMVDMDAPFETVPEVASIKPKSADAADKGPVSKAKESTSKVATTPVKKDKKDFRQDAIVRNSQSIAKPVAVSTKEEKRSEDPDQPKVLPKALIQETKAESVSRELKSVDEPPKRRSRSLYQSLAAAGKRQPNR